MNATFRWMTSRPGLGWLTALPFLLTPAWWAMDNKAPFEVLVVAPATVAPGGTVSIVAQVRRDLHRKCSVSFTRAIYDGKGFRHDLEGVQRWSAKDIEEVDAMYPGELRIRVPVPFGASPPSGRVRTSLDYVCNPWHWLFPLNVITDMPFTIEG